MCHATMDRVRIFDKALSIQDLMEDSEDLKPKSLLWLDFETAQKGRHLLFHWDSRTDLWTGLARPLHTARIVAVEKVTPTGVVHG